MLPKFNQKRKSLPMPPVLWLLEPSDFIKCSLSKSIHFGVEQLTCEKCTLGWIGQQLIPGWTPFQGEETIWRLMPRKMREALNWSFEQVFGDRLEFFRGRYNRNEPWHAIVGVNDAPETTLEQLAFAWQLMCFKLGYTVPCEVEIDA